MEPNAICRLDQAVVNRIAAGEIIQRPSNALKEMIENSLDAKSTNIEVVVKSGGLKLLRIQDNGTGIRADDLGIVCERFTTSKLQNYEDLATISTYGFRGEALSSISHVSHLTILTKTIKDKCAYKACYEDGKLKEKPKPFAGNQGTQITVEDLFYNVPQRKQILKSPTDEYQKIFDVVSKYSIHNSNVGFVLKKYGEPNALRTTPNSTHIDNIRTVYGGSIAKNLIDVNFYDQTLQFTANLYFTNVNYNMKKGILLLFINHRLVESGTIKSMIDQVYTTHLPKGMHPFVYISLELEPSNVDVNVHPTKHEVHFLHEDEILEKVKAAIETELLSRHESRTFYIQSRLPGCPDLKKDDLEKSQTEEKVYDKDLVRADCKIQKLEKFYGNSSKNETNLEPNLTQSDQSTFIEFQSPKQSSTQVTPFVLRNVPAFETKLTSILKLRKSVEDKCNLDLRRIISNLIFMGSITNEQALIQHDTKLYLCKTKCLSEELFYQILLYNFENFDIIEFDVPLSIRELLEIALENDECGWTPEDGPKDELVEGAVNILLSKAPIMKEYFALSINEDGYLKSLPLLIENHTPSLCYLPMFLLRIATEVDWESEEMCFQTFCRESAIYYSKIAESTDEDKSQWSIEHILYPALKEFFLPPNNFMSNSSILQIANLPDLYKVFERC